MRTCLLALPFAFLLACGDDDPGADADPGAPDAAADAAAGDGGPIPDAGGDTDGSTAACNELGNAADAVPVMEVASDPPAPEGGTISDGTYHRIAHAIYTGVGGDSGDTGASFRETVQISGGGAVYDNVTEAVEAQVTQRQTQTIDTDGTSFTLTTTCGTLTIPVEDYTASGDLLTLYGSQPEPFAIVLQAQ